MALIDLWVSAPETAGMASKKPVARPEPLPATGRGTEIGGRPSALESTAWWPLVVHAGSVEALADAIGVNRRTLHRWATGSPMPPTARSAVELYALRAHLKSPV